MLRLEYLPLLIKTRRTQKQKTLTNRVQKAANVEGAFALVAREPIVRRTLLVIDDIYDSGVRRFGAQEIAPEGWKG